ncbi:MAG: hypothetical protein ACQETL_00045 [Bacteroidota bacterium]
MIFKKTLLQISILVTFLTLSNLNFTKAQFQLKDSSNFKLVYKSLIDGYIDSSKFNFVGDFIVHQFFSPRLNKVLGEPVIQILDIRDQSRYEYRPESRKIYDTTPPVQFNSEPNSIINRKDSSINRESYQYFLTTKDNDFGSIPLTCDVFFLKDLELPNQYKIISEIFGGKNSLFPLYHSGIIFRYLSKEGSKTLSSLELESITKADYSEEEILEILSLLDK